jgi:hypothetical protein
MALHLNEDFRRKLKTGKEFSGQKEGFVFLESFDLSSKKEAVPPLQWWDHLDFIHSVLIHQEQNQCFWFVENPSKQTLADLKYSFSVNEVLNGSISGYFSIDKALICAFWNLHRKAYEQEPWHNEEAWGMAGVSEKLPEPQASSWIQKPYWSVEHALRNSDKLHSIFVQMGWFGFLGLRKSPWATAIIAGEFPHLNACA